MLFLFVVYGYILFQASNMISNGSELLLLVPKLAGMIGSVVLPFLGSVPDCAISMHRHQLKSFYVHSCILWSWRHRVCSNSDFYWYRCTCRLYCHVVDHSMGSQVHFLNVYESCLYSIICGRVDINEDGKGNYEKPQGAPSVFSFSPYVCISNRLGQNYPIFIPGL